MDYERLKRIMVSSEPDSIYYVDGTHHVTTEWLVGTFAGAGFYADNVDEALDKMCAYLSRHINHNSIVGKFVTESGWPDLEKVELYLKKE